MTLTREQLAQVSALMEERIQRRLRESGVTIISAANTYIEDGVSIGPDTTIYPFSFIGRDASIGAEAMSSSPLASMPPSRITKSKLAAIFVRLA